MRIKPAKDANHNEVRFLEPRVLPLSIRNRGSFCGKARPMSLQILYAAYGKILLTRLTAMRIRNDLNWLRNNSNIMSVGFFLPRSI